MNGPFAAAMALAFGLAGTAGHAASILAIASNGDVYEVDTSTAAATLFDMVTDLPGNPQIDSPNGLGYNGSLFYTDFTNVGATRQLNRKAAGTDEALTTIPVRGFGNAAGTAEGDTYYYVDNNGNFGTVTGIDGAPGTQTTTTERLFPGGRHGDVDIVGTTAWHSYQSGGQAYVTTFDVTDIAGGFTSRVAQSVLFAGLAFDGEDLFGIAAGNGSAPNKLWQIDPTTLSASLLGDVTGLGSSSLVLTDAAPLTGPTPGPTPIPLPVPALMLIGGIAGLAGLRTARRRET